MSQFGHLLRFVTNYSIEYLVPRTSPLENIDLDFPSTLIGTVSHVTDKVPVSRVEREAGKA